jgi:hypothetical protein
MNFAGNLLRDCDEMAATLRVIRAVVARLQEGGRVDPDMLARLNRFLGEFVECHIHKVEVMAVPRVRALMADGIDEVLASAARYTQCAGSADDAPRRGRPHHQGAGTPAAGLALVPARCLELLAIPFCRPELALTSIHVSFGAGVRPRA